MQTHAAPGPPVRPGAAPSPGLQRAIVALLNGRAPSGEFDAAGIDACLRHYECGGYLHALWGREGGADRLPPVWSAALRRAHRRTAVDNLVALAAFRAVGGRLNQAGIPFILLKGAAYLLDLYDDPGARMLTDVDLLVRKADAGRIARDLAGAGYRGGVGPHYPEDRRFEMWVPGDSGCHFEIHWRLGLPMRLRIDQQRVWDSSEPAELEGVRCLRLAPEDALLYHAGHLADHYFGPGIKWAIDVREMLRRYRLDHERLAERSAEWGVRVALYLALRHADKLFEGQVPAGLLRRLAPGPWRGALLARWASSEPAEALDRRDGPGRLALRPLLIDRPLDALGVAFGVALRPLNAALGRALGRRSPPWEWPA